MNTCNNTVKRGETKHERRKRGRNRRKNRAWEKTSLRHAETE